MTKPGEQAVELSKWQDEAKSDGYLHSVIGAVQVMETVSKFQTSIGAAQSRIRVMNATDRNGGANHGAGSKPAEVEIGVGREFRAARLARGMNIEDVARQLRLSVRQVTALEQDDYDNLASGTFLRGFVRNYAKLLQIDAAPLLQRLEQSLPPTPTPTISYQTEGIPFPSNQGSGKRNLIIAGVAVLVLLLIFEIYDTSEGNKGKQPAVKMETGTGPERGDVPPKNQLPSANSTGGLVSSAEEATVTEQKHEVPAPLPAPAPIPAAPLARQSAPAAVAPEPANASARESANISAPQPASGGDVLRLVFEGESWTEVKDSGGRLLLSRINPRGTEQVLHGKPPFSLTIGNAAAVKLVYNNNPVDLAPYINAYGGTARLSLK
ncbi:RodZ domain-containing protein [Nitrosospira sp. Nsp13]|uniref:RodZ domain-containing protein n=1 Tax=Nitrosospira sp. Nsp13 TaxID=1855332 RepID=UPI00087E2593|nr:RodZ domain-containing protein [Nitrosospira sp. Nsp13]SCY44503.1 cytoskeleton protein RodZ [Nitrosospira sp. Nsp13]